MDEDVGAFEERSCFPENFGTIVPAVEADPGLDDRYFEEATGLGSLSLKQRNNTGILLPVLG